MKIRHSPQRPARIEMLPLIDIVFLLLVFFIYAMLAMAVQKGLHLDLPVSAQATATQESTVTVSISRNQDGLTVYLDKELLALEELGARLTILAKEAKTVPQVSIFAEKGISYQELYSVLDRIGGSGITALCLQAEGAH